MSSCYLFVIERKGRVRRSALHQLIRLGKVVIVMAVCPCQRYHRCNGGSATTCTTCTLLVVGPRGRHVPKGNSRQLTNVDTYFHGCSARKHVDCGPGPA